MKSKRIGSETLLHPVARYKWIYDKESPQSKIRYNRYGRKQGHRGKVAMI